MLSFRRIAFFVTAFLLIVTIPLSASVWGDRVTAEADLQTGQVLFKHTFEDSVAFATWSTDQSLILTASEQTAYVMDAVTGEEVMTLPHATQVWDATWNKDSTRILTTTYDSVQVWDAVSGEHLTNNLFPDGMDLGPNTPYWNEDETRVMIPAGGGNALVVDATSGELLSSTTCGEGQSFTKWSPDGMRLLAHNQSAVDPNFYVCDAATGDELFVKAPAGGSTDVSWNGDGTLLLSTGWEGTSYVWDGLTGEQLLELPTAAFWAQDGKRIVSLLDTGVAILDASSGETLHEIDLGGQSLRAADSQESRFLTVSGNSAFLWEIATAEQTLIFEHTSEVSRAGWSADESRIITVTEDNVVHIWDASDGQLLMILPHETDVWRVSINDAGTQAMVTLGYNSSCSLNCEYALQVWDISQPVALAQPTSVPADGPGALPRIGLWRGSNPDVEFRIEADGSITDFQASVPFANSSCRVEVEDTGAEVTSEGKIDMLLDLTKAGTMFIGYFEAEFSDDSTLSGTYGVNLCGNTMSFASDTREWQAQWVSD